MAEVKDFKFCTLVAHIKYEPRTTKAPQIDMFVVT